MGQRLIVFVLVGGVAGFAAVFLQIPGIILAGVFAAVIAATAASGETGIRLGGYLLGVGVVGFGLVGPAVRGPGGGFLFISAGALVLGYGLVAVAGSLLVAVVALRGIRRRTRGR